MKNFLRKVVEGNGVSPSEICLQSFNENFKDAVNIEWFNKSDYFEAIFYKNNLEHIAIYSLTGILTEYRVNLPSDYLPEPIKNKALVKGEIMNSVMRNKGNMLEYEVIVRDKESNRNQLIFSDAGNLIEEQKL
ncbi:hypothetical protein [Marinilabilia sp.]|uniref:hypothetical protein n=1 Tax=Marinilabilia sp. TaxID=2021252 RepID=UPI0025C38404|nr:hypothetical protein [Marinilabilia sp.]